MIRVMNNKTVEIDGRMVVFASSPEPKDSTGRVLKVGDFVGSDATGVEGKVVAVDGRGGATIEWYDEGVAPIKERCAARDLAHFVAWIPRLT